MRSLLMIREEGLGVREDGLVYVDEIKRMLKKAGIRVAYTKAFDEMPKDKIREFYKEHEGEEFYDWLIEHHVDKPAEVWILRGDSNLHQRIDDLVGDRNPTEAAEGTIRSLSDDDMIEANKQGRMVRNLVHRSKTQSDARREARIMLEDELYRVYNFNQN